MIDFVSNLRLSADQVGYCNTAASHARIAAFGHTIYRQTAAYDNLSKTLGRRCCVAECKEDIEAKNDFITYLSLIHI